MCRCGLSKTYNPVANNTVHTGAAQPIEKESTYLKGSNVYGGTTTPLVQTVKQGNKTTVYKDLDLTWADGRKLKEVKNNTVLLASYTYDQNGNRIAKQTADTGVDYHVDGGKLLAMRRNNEVVNFIYDEKGSILAMDVINSSQNNQGMYYYQKNLQGDVTGLVDSNGNQMVSYTYDSWGKPHSVTGTKAATLGVLNPFRYRGYVYDEETGWYYLKSRYYDSEVGRFLNADGYISTGNGIKGYNMYSYCGNNPLNHADDDGNCYYNINGGIIKDSNCNKLWCKRVNGKYLPSNMVSNDYKNLMDFGKISIDLGLGISYLAWSTEHRPTNIGIGTYNKYIGLKLDTVADALKKADEWFESLWLVGLALEIGENIQVNIANDASIQKITYDALVDVCGGGCT